MPGGDPALNPVGNIQLNCLTFNWQAKAKFLEWRCFNSEVESIFLDLYAAMEEKQKAALTINVMGSNGSN